MLVELSVMEQRYQAVLAVVQDGWKVTEVAERLGVSRQSVHTWIARYEIGGLAALADRSHKPGSCPHQTDPEIEAEICELRRLHPGWGPRRIEHQLGRLGVDPVPSRSAIYRCLRRHGLIELRRRRKRREEFRRWERELPMQLWQMDVMGGVLLDDATELKVVTGVDDHSRFCVAAGLCPGMTAIRIVVEKTEGSDRTLTSRVALRGRQGAWGHDAWIRAVRLHRPGPELNAGGVHPGGPTETQIAP